MTQQRRRTPLQWGLQVLRALVLVAFAYTVFAVGIDSLWAGLLTFLVTLALFVWPLGERPTQRS